MNDLYNSNLFSTPVWDVYDPSYVKNLIKATDSYIKEAKNRNKKYIQHIFYFFVILLYYTHLNI